MAVLEWIAKWHSTVQEGGIAKIWRLVMEEERAVTLREFRVYRNPLEMVTSFNYLWRVLSEADYDWMEVV